MHITTSFAWEQVPHEPTVPQKGWSCYKIGPNGPQIMYDKNQCTSILIKICAH